MIPTIYRSFFSPLKFCDISKISQQPQKFRYWQDIASSAFHENPHFLTIQYQIIDCALCGT